MRRSLSVELWGLDWESLLPLSLHDDGLVASYSSFEACKPFIAAHYPAIFEESEGSPFKSKPHAAKARYLELAGDFIQFSLRGEQIGVLIGTPLDWSSYYLRSAAVLPEHQGRGACQAYLRVLFPWLREHGVERVEFDTSPSNLAMLQVMTRMRFNPTGTVLSERWGAVVRFTKFLDQDCEGTFLRQFCAGVAYQERERRPDHPISRKGYAS